MVGLALQKISSDERHTLQMASRSIGLLSKRFALFDGNCQVTGRIAE